MAPVYPPFTAKVVGRAFAAQYFHILQHTPGEAYRFYHDISKVGRPDDNGYMRITTTVTEINEKLLSLNYGELKFKIKSVDAQESYKLGFQVLVTGYVTGKDNMMRNFVQSFFLAPQEKGGYFVLNDMFRYLEKIDNQDEVKVSVKDAEAPVTTEQGSPDAAPVQEDHISEQTNVLAEEANGEEVHNPSENVEIEFVQEEVPVAEVVDDVPEDSQLVVESNIKIENMPKKSYASIVMDLKDSAMRFSSPAPSNRKTPSKSQEQQVNPAFPSASLSEVSFSSLDAAENGNNQEGEADGYSIYIKGLPYNTTPGLIEDEFKRFGTIMKDGIQVRNKQGFCFGFVEFEEASAVQYAIEASPITVGGRQVAVEEKRSTYSRGNNRGRFPTGRGPGFKNEAGFRDEGMKGRGNLGSRGYSRGEFSGRTEFSNRGNNRGGSANLSGDGYQKAESVGTNGGHVDRVHGLAGTGTAKNTKPRVNRVSPWRKCD